MLCRRKGLTLKQVLSQSDRRIAKKVSKVTTVPAFLLPELKHLRILHNESFHVADQSALVFYIFYCIPLWNEEQCEFTTNTSIAMCILCQSLPLKDTFDI